VSPNLKKIILKLGKLLKFCINVVKMGRKTRKKEKEYESDNESVSEEEFEYQIPWSVLIDDANEKLYDLIEEYGLNNSRFKWLGISDLINMAEHIVYNYPEYENFSVYKASIDDEMYSLITNIIDILELETRPILEPYEIEFVLTNKISCETRTVYSNHTKIEQIRNDNELIISEELIDSDIGVAEPILNKERAILYFNNCIKKIISKYYI